MGPLSLACPPDGRTFAMVPSSRVGVGCVEGRRSLSHQPPKSQSHRVRVPVPPSRFGGETFHFGNRLLHTCLAHGTFATSKVAGGTSPAQMTLPETTRTGSGDGCQRTSSRRSRVCDRLSERRARTTAVATLAAAQNGTSGMLAHGKHASGGAAWATPRTGDQGEDLIGLSGRFKRALSVEQKPGPGVAQPLLVLVRRPTPFPGEHYEQFRAVCRPHDIGRLVDRET
jgi:hypothetical protein